MTTMTPGEVCKELDISPSTLRKYSILFEKEGIIFKRNKNNMRLFTVTELSALRDAMTHSQNGSETLESAVKKAAKKLKSNVDITLENDVMSMTSQRHDADATAVMIEEIRSLKEEIRKRDSLFVEALEELHKEMKMMREEQQRPLIETPSAESEIDSVESQPLQENTPRKRSWWSKFFKK